MLLPVFRRPWRSAEPVGAHEVRRPPRDHSDSPVRSAPGPPVSRLSSWVRLRGGPGRPSFPVGSAWLSREGASWPQDSAGPGREWVRLTSLGLAAAVPRRAEVVPSSGTRARPPRTGSSGVGVTWLLAPLLGLAQPRSAMRLVQPGLPPLQVESVSRVETCGAPVLY